MHRRHLLGAAAATLAGARAIRPALAAPAELVFGRATEHQSIDPHFSQTGPNNATASGVFERLVAFDAHLQLRPSLATSWKLLDPLNWQVNLRPGVRFHDGSPMTPEDVLYSLERVEAHPAQPRPLDPRRDQRGGDRNRRCPDHPHPAPAPLPRC